MRQTATLRRSALCSASFMGLALALATPAYAETGSAEDAQPACDPNNPTGPGCQPGQSEQGIESNTVAQSGAQGESTITVTGSRIRRPNIDSQVPVTSIGGEEFFQQGQNNVGDTLNDLPQLRST